MENQTKINITEIEKRLKELRIEKDNLLQAASEIEGAYLSNYEIRPAGRHLFTIGQELIQDQYAAIVELVKNCYDADSPDAVIVFRGIPEEDCLEIRVEDHGHGMTTKDIINKWLVPSTDYKFGLRKSPRGRIMQGSKGIGRYAASILGKDLKVQTVDSKGIETILYFHWDQLAKCQYLDQIQVPIETKQTQKKSGTILTMHSKLSMNDYWSAKTFKKLRFELKKLIPPNTDTTFDSKFNITLTFENFFPNENDNVSENIKPYPILEFYDYRISGIIAADGIAKLTYENKKIKNATVEPIRFDHGITGCGALTVDIRVYDRDKDAIDLLISRGLQDENGDYVTRQQARQLLNEFNGIGVYRNGFRIRPLGDADFDWLKLNEQRVQNPSIKIGSNQVVGYIHVESEEVSGLQEKSARDGLRNNAAYESLKEITCAVIQELEQRRFIFRRKIGLSNPAKRLEKQLEGLYNYAPLKKAISTTLEKAGMPAPVVAKITDIISKEEYKKNETIEEIKRAVAVYQGQATLGKIINIILHEGRRPLNYFKNQIPNLRFYGERFAQNQDEVSYNEIIHLTNGLTENASIFVNLFGRLDPLSAKRRETKSEFLLIDALKGAIAVFFKECQNHEIIIDFECPSDLKFNGWKQDIYTIIVNLIDNSLFWIVEKECDERKISIIVSKTTTGFILNYTDTGPGINNELLDSGVIFEPEFTTKPHGTGLGLAIAGEAATRNRLTLTALQTDSGVHFILNTDE